MKVVILAGGLGTRLSEETELRPKPMIEIGGRPIIWHIMKLYSHFGFNDFVICLGYKGYVIKEYVLNYFVHMSDITVDLSSGSTEIHNTYSDRWKVTLVDTGLNTMTGGRIKKVKDYIGNETFMMTYGDGVSNVDIHRLIEHHESQKRIATLTAIQPGGRFGILDIDANSSITSFREKSKEDSGWINGGYMVLNSEVFNYIEGDQTTFEREPLERLAREGQLGAYKHSGFWQCMDTLRDKELLERLWERGEAPWKVW